MMLALATILLTLATGLQADVTGRWQGTLSSTKEDGTPSSDSALLILEVKDGAITGTVGGNDEDRHPVTGGKVDGKKVTMTVRLRNGREMTFDLTLDGDQMAGQVASGERKGELVVKRQKP